MSDYPTYHAIVESWGYDIIDMSIFGSYQGDYAVLVQDGDRYGWTVIGYGSCSGCDALQAVAGYDDHWNDDVLLLADQIRDGLHWDSAENLAAYLTCEYVQESEWAWHEAGFREHAAAMAELLRERS